MLHYLMNGFQVIEPETTFLARERGIDNTNNANVHFPLFVIPVNVASAPVCSITYF